MIGLVNTWFSVRSVNCSTGFQSCLKFRLHQQSLLRQMIFSLSRLLLCQAHTITPVLIGLDPVRNSSASVLLFSSSISSLSQCFCFSASVCPNLFKHYLSVVGKCAWAWSCWVFSFLLRQRECKYLLVLCRVSMLSPIVFPLREWKLPCGSSFDWCSLSLPVWRVHWCVGWWSATQALKLIRRAGGQSSATSQLFPIMFSLPAMRCYWLSSVLTLWQIRWDVNSGWAPLLGHSRQNLCGLK